MMPQGMPAIFVLRLLAEEGLGDRIERRRRSMVSMSVAVATSSAALLESPPPERHVGADHRTKPAGPHAPRQAARNHAGHIVRPMAAILVALRRGERNHGFLFRSDRWRRWRVRSPPARPRSPCSDRSPSAARSHRCSRCARRSDSRGPARRRPTAAAGRSDLRSGGRLGNQLIEQRRHVFIRPHDFDKISPMYTRRQALLRPRVHVAARHDHSSASTSSPRPCWVSFLRSVVRWMPSVRAAAAHWPRCLRRAVSNSGGSIASSSSS